MNRGYQVCPITATVKLGDALREGPMMSQPVVYKFKKDGEIKIQGMSPNRGWFLATYKEDDVEYEGWIFKRGVEF